MKHYEGSAFEGFWDNGERLDQKGQYNYANGLQVKKQGVYRLQEPYVNPSQYLARRPLENKPGSSEGPKSSLVMAGVEQLFPSNSSQNPGDTFARETH